MYHIGIDIGGTNLKIGLVNSEMQIAQAKSIPTNHNTPEEMVGRFRPVIEELCELENITMADIDSLGAVVPGSISADNTTVLDSWNIGFHDVPLQPMLQAAFPEYPVYITNDADGAALGELGSGALKGCQFGILLTLGTGLGGGMILNGKLFRGGMGHGSEPGHIYLAEGGEACTCGNLGCSEVYCAASALTREARKGFDAHPDSLIYTRAGGNPENVDPKLVTDCAKEGDDFALTLFNEYLDHLSSMCASMINLLDPEVLAIGGGLCNAGDFLFTPLRLKTHKKCYPREHGVIVPAKLGNDAGMIGAAMLHRNAMQ